MKRLIIFLVRRRLGLKKNEHFRFANQASKITYYYFGDTCVHKTDELGRVTYSNVSLNWLLDDRCEIIKIDE